LAEFGCARVAVHLTPAGLRAVRAGHPWLFDSGISREPDAGDAGSLAVLFDTARKFAGIGLYDPGAPIRVRVLHAGEQLTIDDAWLRQRLSESIERRRELADDPSTDGYRLIHGENDGLPGIVVDRYAGTLVLKLDTAAWLPHVDLLRGLLVDTTGCDNMVLRLSRHITPESGPVNGDVLHGDNPGSIIFSENNIRFEADPVAGQKTGFFLDQRDNRAKVEQLASGHDVLNVFAYTGAFSLYAMRGGARSVISLDISKPALAACQRNIALNQHDPKIAAARHETLAADAFDALAEFADSGRRFGMVILDPPSFARRQRDVDGAVAAYRRVARLGTRLLANNGILVAASCSARVTSETFFDTVNGVVKAENRRLIELQRTAHALDHPIGFPEGAYLKCVFGKVTKP
jgi:23S rRNA (cytosine1962-C5)-methyltransferase